MSYILFGRHILFLDLLFVMFCHILFLHKLSFILFLHISLFYFYIYFISTITVVILVLNNCLLKKLRNKKKKYFVSPTHLSFLSFFIPLGRSQVSFLFSLKNFLQYLLVFVCWWNILSAFIYLKMSLFYLHFWDIFSVYRILGWKSFFVFCFPFNTLKRVYVTGLSCFCEKSAVIFVVVPLYVMCVFSLAAFKIFFPLSLVCQHFDLWCAFHCDFPAWDSLSLLDLWAEVSFYYIWEIWHRNALKYFFCSNVSLSPGTPITDVLEQLILSHLSLRLWSFFFLYFSFDSFCWPVFKFTGHYFCSVQSTFKLMQRIFHFRYCIFHSSVFIWFFFNFLFLCLDSPCIHSLRPSFSLVLWTCL